MHAATKDLYELGCIERKFLGGSDFNQANDKKSIPKNNSVGPALEGNYSFLNKLSLMLL